MFWFLQSQAAVGIILALSIVVAAHNPNPNLRIQDLIGLLILFAAIVGEAIADRQLRAFKSDPANRNAICDVGLWRWSRHPNYFFEWLLWLAYPIIAIDFAGHNPFGWSSLAAPICMYWILVHVSGIPPLEDHMLRSRGEAFRAYQKRTRPFLPLPLEVSGHRPLADITVAWIKQLERPGAEAKWTMLRRATHPTSVPRSVSLFNEATASGLCWGTSGNTARPNGNRQTCDVRKMKYVIMRQE